MYVHVIDTAGVGKCVFDQHVSLSDCLSVEKIVLKNSDHRVWVSSVGRPGAYM